MIRIRLAFYALFVVLGAVIFVRALSAGLRIEILPAVVFALALAGLGIYRIRLWSTYR